MHVSKWQDSKDFSGWLCLLWGCKALFHAAFLLRVSITIFSNVLSFQVNAIDAPVSFYTGWSQLCESRLWPRHLTQVRSLGGFFLLCRCVLPIDPNSETAADWARMNHGPSIRGGGLAWKSTFSGTESLSVSLSGTSPEVRWRIRQLQVELSLKCPQTEGSMYNYKALQVVVNKQKEG